MRRIAGVDINGWKDMAARDWSPCEEDAEKGKVFIVHGGAGSVAVRQASDIWVGGPQAALSHHGRGGGWGALGSPDRRVDLTAVVDDILSGSERYPVATYAATVDALTRGAESLVVGLPDVPASNEAAQGRVLNIVRSLRRSQRLLWRSVAAFLHALETGAIARDVEGESFRFLIHSGEGLEVQTLRLRRDADHDAHVAPERDGFGSVELKSLGLRNLVQLARQMVHKANPVLVEAACEESRLPLKLLCGEANGGDKEILRLDNGNWLEVTAPVITPDTLPEAIGSVDFSWISPSADVANTFLLTPLAEPFRTELFQLLQRGFSKLSPLDWSGIASGCLMAGRLIDRGLPHYFDRLTPIRLAVLNARTGDPEFEDLIGTSATLPANREYVSPPFQSFEWPTGKHQVEFYLLKGENEVRHWIVKREKGPLRNVKVEIRLRQTPGQSWARLSLTSPEWAPLQRAPISLDWVDLTHVDESPAEILERLRTPPPPIPSRIVEGAHLVLWNGDAQFSGLVAAMAATDPRGKCVPKKIADCLAHPWRDPTSRVRYWAVGTDGDFPKNLPAQHERRLRNVLGECKKQVLSATQLLPLRDNHALRCLTWCFTLCPESIQDAIVDALEANLDGCPHPLLVGSTPGRQTILTQGAGRVVTGPGRLKRLVRVLVARRRDANTLNALAMVMSRRKEAPYALTEDIVGALAMQLADELLQLTGSLSFNVRFRNALSALAGLFRYREVNRYALLANRDPVAQQILNRIERIERLLKASRARISGYEEKLALTASIKDYLNGGGDPDILIRIENMG